MICGRGFQSIPAGVVIDATLLESGCSHGVQHVLDSDKATIDAAQG